MKKIIIYVIKKISSENKKYCTKLYLYIIYYLYD